MKKALRYIIIVLSIMIFLPSLVVFLLYRPKIQRIIVDKSIPFIENIYGYKISYSDLCVKFPFNLYADSVLIKLSETDTMAFVSHLHCDVDTKKLFQSILKINLDVYDALYMLKSDSLSSVNLKVKLDTLKLPDASINIPFQLINVDSLFLASADVSLKIIESDIVDTDTTSSNGKWKITFNSMQLSNVNYDMDLKAIPYFVSGVQYAEFYNGKVDVENTDITLDSLYVNRGFCNMKLSTSDDVAYNETVTTTQDSVEWEIRVGRLRFDDGSFDMLGNSNSDFLIKANSIGFVADSIYDRGAVVKANLRHISLSSPMGWQIETMNGFCDLADNYSDLSKCYIKTPLSQISLNCACNTDVTHLIEDIPLNVDVVADVAFEDIKPIWDAMPDEMLGRRLKLKTLLDISEKCISIDYLSAIVENEMSIDIKGDVVNYTAFNKLNVKTDVKCIIYKPYLLELFTNDAVTLPDTTIITASVNGSSPNFNLKSNVNFVKGFMDVVATINIDSLTYTANIATTDFPVGRVMRVDKLGNISSTINSDGTILQPMDINGNLLLSISDVGYDASNYRGITVSGTKNGVLCNFDICSVDTAAMFNLNVSSDTTNGVVVAELKGKIDVLDLKALGLLSDPAKLSSGVFANLQMESPEKMTFYSTFAQLKLSDIYGIHNLGSLMSNMMTNSNNTNVDVFSGDMHLNIIADTTAISAASMLSDATSRLLRQIHDRDLDVEVLKSQMPSMSVNFKASQNNILSKYLKLKGVSFRKMQLGMDCETQRAMTLHYKLDRLLYSDVVLDSVTFDVSQQEKGLAYNSKFYSSGESMKGILNFTAFGDIMNDGLSFGVTQKDVKGQVGWDFGVKMNVSNDSSVIMSFFPEEPIIACKKWTLDGDNTITYTNNAKLIANMNIHNGDKYIKFFAKEDSLHYTDRLGFKVKNLDLGNISATLPFVPDMSGIFEADVALASFEDRRMIKGLVSVSDLNYENSLIGNIAVVADYNTDYNLTNHQFNFDINVDNVKRADVSGSLLSDDNISNVDVSIEMMKLPISLLNAFIPSGIASMAGMATGNIDVKGNIDKLQMTGGCKLDSASVKVLALGTTFSLDTMPLIIEKNKALINDFKLTAVDGSNLVLNGNMDFTEMSDVSLFMTLSGNKFQLVNVKENDESMVYGKAYVDLMAKAEGKLSALRMNAKVNVLDETSLVYTMRQTDPELIDNSVDLVRFVPFSDTTRLEEEFTAQKAASDLFFLTSLINIDKNVSVRVNISEDGNDNMSVVGGGNLLFSINPENGITMTGRYTVDQGNVVYNVPIAGKQSFAINDGSYLEWTNDIMNPIMNISASERIKTNVTTNEQTSRLTNMDAIINISSSLLSMNIDFDLDSPNDNVIRNQLSTLTSEERTKKAMNLLIYRSYTGIEEGSSETMSNIASNTLYSFVENELNKYTAKTGLTFGIDSYGGDDGSGLSSHTDYSYQFSKQLFNNRINIKIGGRVSTDDDPNTQADIMQNLVDDIAIEYIFGKSRSLYAKIFRQTNYESVLEGNVTATGVGLVFRRSYDNISDILRKKSRRGIKALQRKQKQLEKEAENEK